MREKFWSALGTIPFVADGGSDGQITVLDTCGMYVKQKIILKSGTQVDRVDLIIKRVLNSTDIVVGKAGTNLKDFEDISAYTTADSATIRIDEQSRPNIPKEDREHAMFAEEPIVARRVISVDCQGEYFSVDNPIPVQLTDGSINIGTVNAELEVQLSHQDNIPDAGDVADSVQVGDGTDILGINTDGSINTNIRDEAGASFTADNPLPVAMEESESDKVCDFQTTVDAVTDADNNHDYTVTALKTFVGTRVWVTASSSLKVEIQLETGVSTGVFDTILVAFNSNSNHNINIPLDLICGKQIAGAIFRIVLINLDNKVQDLYSTLLGTEK